MSSNPLLMGLTFITFKKIINWKILKLNIYILAPDKTEHRITYCTQSMIYFSTDETIYRRVRNKAIKYNFNFQRDNTFTLLLKRKYVTRNRELTSSSLSEKKFGLLFWLSAGQHIVYIFKIYTVTIRPVAKKQKTKTDKQYRDGWKFS